jgi:hypothetical protein
MSLSSGDLTTISTASAYVGDSPSASVLAGLITRISRMLLAELNRPFILPRTYNDSFSGSGTRQLILPNWPVLSVSSVYIDGALATEASPLVVNGVAAPFTTASGWSFPAWDGVPPGNPAVIVATGWPRFCFGLSNIGLTYRAGYEVSAEAAVIPATPWHVTPEQPYGTWASDGGVTYADGTALVAIASGTPTVGQYVPPNPGLSTPRNYYQFAVADEGEAVLLTYGFIPADLEQAVLELIADRYAYRRRAGIRSQSLASQETIVYDNTGLSAFVDATLSGYKSVLPPALGVYV